MQEGISLYKKGKYSEALTYFKSVKISSGQEALYSYYLGLCYTKLNRFDEALLYLEQVVTSELSFAIVFQCRMILGYIYSETERYKMAAWEFQRLLQEGFESAKVYSALAHVLYLERNIKESVNKLERALKLEPDNTNAMNSLGFVMAEGNMRLGQALIYCQKAVNKFPEHAPYLDSLGWVYHKMGKRREALESLRKAVIISPEKKVIKDHLRIAVGTNG